MAISSISAHVFGGCGTRSLRYQSNCVFVLNGAEYRRPFQLPVWIMVRIVPFST